MKIIIRASVAVGPKTSGPTFAWPSAPLTGNSTNLLVSSTYGNGAYTASASSFYTAGNEAFRAFDKITDDSNIWNTGTNSYAANTPYATATSFYQTTVGGTVYNGEWLDIVLPSSIVLSRYSLNSRSNSAFYAQSPSSWIIAGSNNGGSTWALVDSQSLKPFTYASQTQTFIISGNSSSYNEYRIIIQAVSASYQSYGSVAEWILYGALSTSSAAAPTIPNPSFEILGPNPAGVNLSSSGTGAMWAIDTYSSNVWIPGWIASGSGANTGLAYGLGWNGTIWTPNPLNGTYVLLMENPSAFTMSTTVTGLTPNTLYTITGYFALKPNLGPTALTLSVNGTSLLSYSVISPAWIPKQVTFLSGPSTTATLEITNNGNNLYADNLYIVTPTSVSYPPAALTSNTLTTLSGQSYGNGNYVATCSSIFGAGYEVFRAFDKTTNIWHNQFAFYNILTGLYTGTHSGTTVGGNVVYGEWIDLLLSTPLILTSYSIQARGDQYYTETPAKWLIVGSNNGGYTWTIVDQQISVGTSAGTTNTFKVAPSQSYYNEYRIVIQGTSIPAGGGFTSIAEWILYGIEPLLYQLGLTFSIYNGYFADNVNSSVFSSANLIISGTASNLTDINTATNNYNLNGINGGTTFSIVHYGKFLCTLTGTWTWSLNSDDAAYLWLGSTADSGYTTTNTTVKYPGSHGMAGPITGPIAMTAGVYYSIRVMFGQNTGGYGLQVGFTPPGGSIITNGSGYYYSSIDFPPQDVLYTFTTFTFTNAGATSGTGPTYAQTQSSYGTGWWNNISYFNVGKTSLYTSIFPNGTTGYQIWTVPKTGAYNITIAGAGGSSGTGYPGGSGVVFTKSNYNLTKNDILIICVGQVGTSIGGGGGTFVYNYTLSTLLFVAGGGGGWSSTGGGSTQPGGNANTETSGGGGGLGGAGGTGGNGGAGGEAGGGGGYVTNGTGNSLGRSFINLGTGTGGGGFGGGAGQGSNYGGGGGGGYSGGGGGGNGGTYNPGAGGGGGSYDITVPSGPVSGTATNNGMGYVIVTAV